MSNQERTAQEYANLIERQGYAHPMTVGDIARDTLDAMHLNKVNEITKQALDALDGAFGIDSTKDFVNHPPHYTAHPSGVECIQVTEHMNFCLGNAVKYIWRADLKDNAIEDLKKAVWYVNREIERRKSLQAVTGA
jgi:hypothetical protein